jgi:hypothetical protein
MPDQSVGNPAGAGLLQRPSADDLVSTTAHSKAGDACIPGLLRPDSRWSGGELRSGLPARHPDHKHSTCSGSGQPAGHPRTAGPARRTSRCNGSKPWCPTRILLPVTSLLETQGVQRLPNLLKAIEAKYRSGTVFSTSVGTDEQASAGIHRRGADASDQIEYLSERLLVTFAHSGIDVERVGLFDGPRDCEIAGRFAISAKVGSHPIAASNKAAMATPGQPIGL